VENVSVMECERLRDCYACSNVATCRRDDPHLEQLVRELDDCLLRLVIGAHRGPQPPPLRTRPGRRPAGAPSATTGTPLTNTSTIPSARWRRRRWPRGRSYTISVGRIATRAGSKSTRSAA